MTQEKENAKSLSKEQEWLMNLSKKRLRNDRKNMNDSLGQFVKTVHPKISSSLLGERTPWAIYDAFCMVCSASHIKTIGYEELSEKATNPLTVDYLARLSQINLREILLEGQWWKQDNGPLLAYMEEDGRPVALLPKGPGKYLLVDPTQGTKENVAETVAEQLKPHGVMFYRPFPAKSMNLVDLMKFAMQGVWIRDSVIALGAALLGALLGLIVPKVTQQIFDVYIPGGEVSQLAEVGLLMVGFLVGKSLFELSRALAMLRLEGKMEATIQSAVWDRLLSLPVGFFKDYTAGELAMRAFGISQIRALISGAMTNTILTGAFSIVYLFQVFHYGGKLAWYSIIMLVLLLLLSYWMGKLQMKYEKNFLEITNKTSGLVLQLFNAIPKFRVAGAENRAFRLWSDLFTQSRQINFRKETITTIVNTVLTAAPLVFNLMFYVVAVKKGVSLQAGMFIAFTTAFGSLSSGMISIVQTVIQINVIKPTYEMSRPILESLPEYSEIQEDPGLLSGSLKVSGLSFRYDKDGPWILKNISLVIQEGEYVAIVGPSGSGKSTLFRMLLGFEKPDAGQVYYDEKDLATINVREVRRQMGVVLQNAQVMSGDIFTNIIGANTKLTMEDAMRAVKMAGMEEDIAEMPMGMHTVVSEGATTLSGGQRQRLLIARAIVNNPKILFFDEATSALDNKTQKIVQESLDGLHSTRVVIAHRLSTIINCDRIIVVDKGEIVEEGNYSSLMAKSGVFAKMAERQII